MDQKYTYKFWVTNLADGGFNKSDSPLHKMLDDGYKPLRETVIDGTGYVLFVLSRPVTDGV